MSTPVRPREFEGVIRIEWRASEAAIEYHGMPGWTFTIRDETGGHITTVSHLVIHARADALVWAECEMWAGADGKPVYGAVGEATQIYLDDDKNILTGVFAFEVASMSVVP